MFYCCYVFSEIRPDSEISVINMPNYVVDELKYSLGKLDLDFWTFLNLGKIRNLMTPSDLIWEKIQIGKILNFGNPPSEKNKHKLKTLKIA